jgi:hypothetical protein
MATSKLTLSIDTNTIEWAKKHVDRKNISLSKFIQNQLNDIAKKEAESDPLLEKLKNMEIPDDIKSLTGILKGKYPDGISYDDMKYEYFKDRYGL